MTSEAQSIIDFIATGAVDKHLRDIVAAVNARYAEKRDTFTVGDKVIIYTKTGPLGGTVTSIGRKNIKVDAGSTQWTVHPAFLDHA